MNFAFDNALDSLVVTKILKKNCEIIAVSLIQNISKNTFDNVQLFITHEH